MTDPIQISSRVEAPLATAWLAYTREADITAWNQASPEWHCPSASNDLRVGGAFNYRMEAVDGSFGFDYSGSYQQVEPEQSLDFTLDDGRKVEVSFTAQDDQSTTVSVAFEPEQTNPLDLQRAGWQAILDSYAAHAATLPRS